MTRWFFVLAISIAGGVMFIGCESKSATNRGDDQASIQPSTRDNDAESSVNRGTDAETAASATPSSNPTSSLDRQATIDRAHGLAENGDFDSAAKLLQGLLLVDPSDVEVLFQMGNVQAANGDLAAAIECLGDIPEDHPEAGIPALGQSADWCVRLKRYDDAIDRYQRVLGVVPQAAMARRQLAYLLNRQGRRHEAAVQIRELCRVGDVRQDELQSLIVLSDAMSSDSTDANGGAVDYTPIGASGKARKLFTERRYAEAAEVLRETIAKGDAPASVVAFYGRTVAEAQDDEAFRWWFAKVEPSVKEYSEYWSAIAAYLASQRQFEAATRALLEALDRDPTDFISINRLLQMLKMLGDQEAYDKWEARWKSTHETLLASNAISDSATPKVESMEELAAQLNAIDRRLEAVVWKSLESYYRKLPQQAMAHWNQQRQQLVDSGADFPDRSSRLCGVQLDTYPLPNIEIDVKVADATSNAPSVALKASPSVFRNVAGDYGLRHTFEVAGEPLESGFAMYHQAGGGVAVLDFDLDGFADLYFAQGAAEPPTFVSSKANQLFRSSDGALIDVSVNAACDDARYTIGCTAGDWNQDGFPDLITANIGANSLWINNGDGTFTGQVLEGSDDLERMPASIAMADLSGDRIPDIFEVNYIQDPEIGRLPSRNAEGVVMEAVGPADFDACVDRIGLNDGRGNPVFQTLSEQPAAAHKGLGLVIAELDGNPGNDVFVGNDKSANQFWVRDPAGEWSDVAVLNGTAFSYGGAGTASMGIASGDFDKNGTLDLHIANFQNESVCLYLNGGSYFQDRALQYRLGVPSRSVLGFGSQSLDYDNDGRPDLVVTNGHIDSYSTMSGPFKQLPQLFSNLGDRFQLVPVQDESSYWGTPHLGRALATFDLDRDGRTDFVITHVGESSAIMRNETDSGNWLQLQFVGTKTERDAVGATVRVTFGDEETTEFVTGGDGYLCRNESIVALGVGPATIVDRINVTWPSGIEQEFTDVAANQRLLVVEDQSDAFTLFETD
ncbi:MAG: FG-GAP-like repeat-containing protein [Rubripirellula sp.]